jgi:hypothetical protein
MTTAQTTTELRRLYKEAAEINVALIVAHDEGRYKDEERRIGELDEVTRKIYELTLWRVKGVRITLARAS